MARGISVIKWDDKIGAFLTFQHPLDLEISVEDVMSIYNIHRQNTLEPNFGVLSKGKLRVASFFTGLKTTRYMGAPNFTVSLFLDPSENPVKFKRTLPQITVEFIKKYTQILPSGLDKIPEALGLVIVQKQKDTKPFIMMSTYREPTDLTQQMLSDIYNLVGNNTTPHFFESQIGDYKIACYFTGIGNRKIILDSAVLVYVLKKDFSAAADLRASVPQISFEILMNFSTLLAETLNQINESELESLMTDFHDFGESRSQELESSADDLSLSDMVEKLELKTKVETLESKLDETLKEKERSAMMLEGTREATEHLIEQITHFQNELIESNNMIQAQKNEILNLRTKLHEKEEQIRKLLDLIRSLRNYVSY
ncbi:MAG: hypothetical protein ACXQS8_01195 [Candidatus Helarchaeales archaeon]